MTNLKQVIIKYIAATLGLQTTCKPFSKSTLPFYIQDGYQFMTMQLAIGSQTTLPALLIYPTDGHYPGVVALRKHLTQVQKITDMTLVYVNDSLSAAQRRSLIDHHICFIQPGYQLFIPDFALDLREAFQVRRTNREITRLLPAAQAILMSNLYRGWLAEQSYTSSQLMGDYRYSRVTLAKVIAQLQILGMLEPGTKTNTYRFTGTKANIYQKARPYLRSPVKRKVAIDHELQADKHVFLAGETALAHYSLLAEPPLPVFGMTNKQFTALLAQKVCAETDAIDHTRAWVEIWSYHSATTEGYVADELSLLLCLEAEQDERIQTALGTIKESFAWITSEDYLISRNTSVTGRNTMY